MSVDLAEDPDLASELCRSAQTRLIKAVTGLTDDQVRSPSRLPGWSIGHVLSHLTRNADGHARRLGGALRGEDLAKYPGGRPRRDEEINRGAARPAAEIVADLAASQERLDVLLADSAAAGWPNSHFLGDTDYPVSACPAHRLREVEMHHVDLGIGYEPSDWSDEYVGWELPVVLAGVPERLSSPEHRRRLLAWLTGRGPAAADISLDPW